MTSKTEKFSIQEVSRTMTIQNENKHKPLPKQKSEKKTHLKVWEQFRSHLGPDIYRIRPKTFQRVCRIAQSVQQLATGWTVRGSNPVGGEIFRTCPDRPCEPTQPPVQWVPGLYRR
jgi:hypothetical protein